MSADGRVAVIGAVSSASDADVPAVYVLVYSGAAWKVAQTVSAGSSNDRFGRSVAVSSDGRTIVVGDPKEPPDGIGVAHVFSRFGSEWTETAELKVASGDFTFGRSEERRVGKECRL